MSELSHARKQFPIGRILMTVGVCLCAPSIYFITQWLSLHPQWVEKYYSTGIYPYIAQILSMVTGWIPVSVAEWILLLGIPGIAVFMAVQAYRMFTRPHPFARLARTICALLMAASLGYSAFYLLWGWNYHRVPLEETLGLQDVSMSTELLYEVCQTLIPEAAALRETLPEDEKGCVALPQDLFTHLTQVNGNYILLSQEYPGLWGTHYGPPKAVVSSVAMSYADISGIYIPYTAEANVNVDMPVLLQLSTASHEAAHQRGIAREDEANFMAILSCMASEDPSFQYSGRMLALIYCMNQLYSDDYGRFSACYELYSNAQKRDLAQHNAYWKAFEGPVQEVSNTVNDNYLKANHQEEGVKSYDRVVTLILKWYAVQIS